MTEELTNKFEVTTQSIFDCDSKIIDKLIELIQNYLDDPTAKIRVSSYDFEMNNFFTNLSKGKSDIKIIFEPCAAQDSSILCAYLEVMGDSKARLRRNGKKHNHHKFLLLENKNEKIVIQTSCNFKITTRSNDLIVVRDEEIYDFYLKRWNKIWNEGDSFCDKKRKDLFSNEISDDTIDFDSEFNIEVKEFDEFSNKNNTIKCIFSPISEKNDPILNRYFLYKRVEPNTSFCILQSQFENKRGELIANRIVKLAKEKNCAFRILATKYKNESEESGGYLSKQVNNILVEGANLYKDNIQFKIFKKKHKNNHSKLVLMEETNNQNIKKVLTGSHNFDKSSLDLNDEALLRINDTSVYSDYITYFNLLWNSDSVEFAKKN